MDIVLYKQINSSSSSSTSSSSSSSSNGNSTEWSPIRTVIIRVINKIGRPRSGSPNHNFNKICDIIGYFLNQNSKFCFASSEKKTHLSGRVMARTVQLLSHDLGS